MTMRAAQYVRMSTEQQDYSITLQTTAIAAYAAAKDYEVVHTYADEGLSGLTAERRPGLQKMLGEVLGGTADFAVKLVWASNTAPSSFRTTAHCHRCSSRISSA
jgi:DNA invertase Pin-like site-specific DNA recombinase